MSRADWCQFEGCFDNKVTPESRSRGFGPGGWNTEVIQKVIDRWYLKDRAFALARLGRLLVRD